MIIVYSTGKAELCFVKAPGNSFNYVVRQMEGLSDLWYESHYGDSDISNWIELPEGNWQIVGNPFDLSEENLIPIVPQMKDSGFPFEVQDITDTWKELLDKWEIYQTNPYQKPDINDEKYFPITDDEKDTLFMNDWDQWEQAEERTGSFILLKKIAS